jgi:hypothetical protein
MQWVHVVFDSCNHDSSPSPSNQIPRDVSQASSFQWPLVFIYLLCTANALVLNNFHIELLLSSKNRAKSIVDKFFLISHLFSGTWSQIHQQKNSTIAPHHTLFGGNSNTFEANAPHCRPSIAELLGLGSPEIRSGR